MRPSTPQQPRHPARPGRGSSSASGRRRPSAGHRRSPEGRPSPQRPSSDAPDPTSRRALAIARRERRRRRARNRFLYGTAFVVALALIVVGLRVWGIRPGFALPLGSSPKPSTTPSQATAVPSARASASRAASPSASAAPSASPTPSASALPSPRLDSEGFAHSGAVGNGTWTIAPAVPVSRPAAATVYRYVLRVEGGTHVDAAAAAPIVERILNDERGWPTAQNTSFQPVADPTSADFTFNIATPPSADALCSPLDTGGMWSCRNGDNVVINSDRWNWGAITYPDVDSYRIYVTNHEVGHFLGHEHEFCAGAGLKAPLMAQQSHDLAGGCVYNAWPTQDNQPG
ncbi:hypothetical protein BKH31_08065 [Actinomyces oris]|uniref:DUF3152 domain-containing protein n=1 Tax=Actinomyces oris TaxID=544580 RepID=A0A1Q8VDA5_9ACTO|nr:DUF3152 domain-containing protein [Actinomyces oris]OLO46080.1 hypothetical protein BKH31_08065 [Actinomyces oris]